jgi:hypothetical protein
MFSVWSHIANQLHGDYMYFHLKHILIPTLKKKRESTTRMRIDLIRKSVRFRRMRVKSTHMRVDRIYTHHAAH